MNLPLTVFARRALCLLFIILLPAAASAQAGQDSQDTRRAEVLWEQAVAAKGGREQLYKVGGLLVSYRETARNFLGGVVHRGDVESLYVFPDKLWSWDDGLPPPFHLSVGWVDLGRNRRCILHKGVAAPACNTARPPGGPGDRALIQAQYLYLLETRWVKPEPFGVSEGRVGLKKADVLHTRFGDNRVDYFLDRETHLPLRVSVFHKDGERATLRRDFSDYAGVGGVMMPGRLNGVAVNFQINPSYDEAVFTRAPSLEAGPHAWRPPGR
jgi:hypothetical protein